MTHTSKQVAPQHSRRGCNKAAGPPCPVAGRDGEINMSASRSEFNRRCAKRRIMDKLAKARKKNTPPSIRDGESAAPTPKPARHQRTSGASQRTKPPRPSGPRTVPPAPASVVNSTGAHTLGLTHLCSLCGARFHVSDGAARFYAKKGWAERTCCYDFTNSKKLAVATAA